MSNELKRIKGEVSRRSFVCGVGMGAAALGVAAAASSSTSALAEESGADEDGAPAAGSAMEPGTYEATAAGASGDITVSVTTDDTSIIDIEVGENNETAYLMNTVVNTIPEHIIEAQSLTIDTVTGATLASRGVINAVADCLEQAGADLDAWQAEHPVEPTEETRDVDVVVVGSGLAGMMAAQRLKELGVNDVLLLEKQGMVGGSGVYSAGQMYGAIDEEDLDYVRSVYMERTMTFPMTEDAEDYPSAEKVDVLINEGHTTFEYFKSLGYELEYTDMTFLDTPADTRVCLINPAAEAEGITSVGEQLHWTLRQAYEQRGGETLVEAPVTSLIVTDGAVTGVQATTPTGTLTVNAPYVIICTGSAGRGHDVLAQWCPHMADGEVRVLTMGSDGSGIQMMADAGAAVSTDWIGATAGIFSVDPTSQLTNNTRNISVASTSELFVDNEGHRLCAEFTEGSNVYYYNKVGVENCVYVVFDSALAEMLGNTDTLESSLENFSDRVFKADTLKELAEMADLPVEDFLDTVATYNSYCANGVDDSFGKDADDLVAIEEAPFYLVRCSVTGKDVAGGVLTDTACRVLDESGNVIGGLFACGFAGNRDFYGTEVVGSVGLQTCVTGGRLAAEGSLRNFSDNG